MCGVMVMVCGMMVMVCGVMVMVCGVMVMVCGVMVMIHVWCDGDGVWHGDGDARSWCAFIQVQLTGYQQWPPCADTSVHDLYSAAHQNAIDREHSME